MLRQADGENLPKGTDIERDKFVGCVLGLALGDALGAPHEGGPLERLAWRCIGRTRSGEMRWTDDTQMSLDLMESLIAKKCLDLDDAAVRFARSYRWSRGYGRGAAKVLKKIRRGMSWSDANRSVFPNGSFGNGGAMRAPVIGLFFVNRPDELRLAAEESARVTHSHPLGMAGAVLIAGAVAQALRSAGGQEILASAASNCRDEAFLNRIATAQGWLGSQEPVDAGQVAAQLGNSIVATGSCVTSLYIGVRFLSRPFMELQEFCHACGGDTDTIAAMSAAIWGAANGARALPSAELEKLEARERLEATATDLYRIVNG